MKYLLIMLVFYSCVAKTHEDPTTLEPVLDSGYSGPMYNWTAHFIENGWPKEAHLDTVIVDDNYARVDSVYFRYIPYHNYCDDELTTLVGWGKSQHEQRIVLRYIPKRCLTKLKK